MAESKRNAPVKHIRYPLTIIFLSVFLMIGLSGCEAVFTFPLFSSLRRDPNSLSPEQKITYAKDALKSTDPQDARDAYDVIEDLIGSAKGEKKIELQLLAADLALKGSGVDESLLGILAAFNAASDPSAGPDTVTNALLEISSGIDDKYASKFLEQIDSLPEDQVTSEQYFYAAMATILMDPVVIESLGKDPASISPEVQEKIDRAQEYIALSIAALPGDGTGGGMADFLTQYQDLLANG